MIEKGIGLFKTHPLTGIGLNNFTGTKGEIQGAFEGFERIKYKKLDIGKSAHNSYIGLLSEGGLVVIIPFFIILFLIIKHFLLHYKTIPAPEKAVYIGILMMSVHLYFISAILNVFAWFLIGLASALVYRDNNENISSDI
jgi:O-antigen ligase